MSYPLALLALLVLAFFAVPLALSSLVGRRQRVPPWLLAVMFAGLLVVVAIGIRNPPVALVALLLGAWAARPWRWRGRDAAGRPGGVARRPR